MHYMTKHVHLCVWKNKDSCNIFIDQNNIRFCRHDRRPWQAGAEIWPRTNKKACQNSLSCSCSCVFHAMKTQMLMSIRAVKWWCLIFCSQLSKRRWSTYLLEFYKYKKQHQLEWRLFNSFWCISRIKETLFKRKQKVIGKSFYAKCFRSFMKKMRFLNIPFFLHFKSEMFFFIVKFWRIL